MTTTYRSLILILLIFLAFNEQTIAQQNQSALKSCDEKEEFHMLDFWIGEWNVYEGNNLAGTNTIEKIVKGCAIIENWTSKGGSEGKSFFYYYPQEKRWKQVWVTQNPFSWGGVKEKEHIETLDNGAMRFQGKIISRNGKEIYDRTTLTPMENGQVRQVIESSIDGGESWKINFDAIYKPLQ